MLLTNAHSYQKLVQARLDDLEGEHGIKVVHRRRDGRSRKAAGGVAIAFRTGACNLRKRELKSRKEGQEILCVTGKLGKVPQKVAIIAVYVPPDTKAQGFRELCNTLVTEIAAIKTALVDPVIYVARDFNHRDVGPSLDLADNLKLIVTPPTRGLNNLDLIYTNAWEECKEALGLPQLDTSAGVRCDHSCGHIRSEFPSVRDFTRVAKMRRSRNKASEDAFAAELDNWDSSGLAESGTVNDMAQELEKVIAALTEQHFPLVRVRR